MAEDEECQLRLTPYQARNLAQLLAGILANTAAGSSRLDWVAEIVQMLDQANAEGRPPTRSDD